MVPPDDNQDVITSNIFIYPKQDFIQIEHSAAKSCDSVCLDVIAELRKNFDLDITPLVRTLFGLRCWSTKMWLPDSERLQPDELYEFRLRFKIPEMSNLKDLDLKAYEYLYYQVDYDFLHSEMTEIDYNEKRNDILGLCVTNMCFHQSKYGTSPDDLIENYANYVPKEIFKYYSHNPFSYAYSLNIKKKIGNIIKRKITIPTICSQNNENIENNENKEEIEHNHQKFIELYTNGILAMAHNYLNEMYDVSVNNYAIKLIITPFDKENSGICLKHPFGRIERIAKIEDLFSVRCKNNDMTLNMFSNTTYTITFQSVEEVKSCISCITMYFRLMQNWISNISPNLHYPSLDKLLKTQSHGPITMKFSHMKLNRELEDSAYIGLYIIRQSPKSYDTYFADVLNWQSKQIGLVKMIENESRGGIVIDGELPAFMNNKESFGKYKCIPPSDFDKCPELLLGISKSSFDKARTASADTASTNGIIDIEHLSKKLDVSPVGKRIYHLSEGCLNDNKKYFNQKVTIKTLELEKNQFRNEFLEAGKILMKANNENILMCFGLTIFDPVSIVLEPVSKGRYSKFLRMNKSKIPFSNLITTSVNLAHALRYLDSIGIKYGKLRCSCLYVTEYVSDTHIVVKLGGPILPKTYTSVDLPWIPLEFRNSVNERQSDIIDKIKDEPTTIIWAYGTTIWEIFSYGKIFNKNVLKELISIPNLEIPDACQKYTDIYSIMVSCWNRSVSGRPDLLNVLSKWNEINNKVQAMKPTETSANETKASTSNVDCNVDDAPSSDEEDNIDEVLKSSSKKHLVPTYIEYGNYRVHVAELDSLGFGVFGSVHLGTILTKNDSQDSKYPTEVAVKILNNYETSLAPYIFRAESNIMRELNNKYILKIYGYFEEINYRISVIILERCLTSLDKYLIEEGRHLKEKKLLYYAENVAEGLKYLHTHRITHRDVAARNVLLKVDDAEKYAKLGDFGKSEKVIEGDYNEHSSTEAVPILWYAPEFFSPDNSRYAFQSDVWSFGVTVYEFFTKGEPLPNLQEFYKNVEDLNPDPVTYYGSLKNNVRYPPLQDSDDLRAALVYQKLILPCWRFEEKERPTFDEILTIISELKTNPIFE